MSWPTTNAPRRNFVTMRFTDDEFADLQEMADDTTKGDRSKALRAVIGDATAKHKRRKAKRTATSTAPEAGDSE